MSLASQTTARRQGRGFLMALAVSVAIVLAALSEAWRPLLQMAAQARPHAPDLSVLTSLSPVVQVHLYTALAALALGAVLMIVRKGRTFHRIAGWTWIGLVATTAISTLFITSMNDGRWSFIHLFTGWTLFTLPLAVFWARRRAVARHRQAMMGLFYGAFAVNLFFTFIPGRTMWNLFFG